MTEDLLGQGEIQRHQEDGPVEGVEPENVLADDMDVSGPVLGEVFAAAVGVVAQGGDIVGEGVQPDIDHMAVVKAHRDAPLEGGTGDAEVLQAGFQEVVDHFLFPGLGDDEVGVFLDVLHEPVLVFAHPEEVGLLLGGLDGAAAVGAAAVLQLALGPEGFTGGAVHAGVLAFIDVTLVIEPLEDFLNHLFVVVVGGADKVVVAGVHGVPDGADLAGDLVHIGLGGHTGGARDLLDFLAVLIGAGAEEDVVALHSLEAGDGVGEDDFIGVADVGFPGGVGNGGGNVELFLFHGDSFFLDTLKSPVSALFWG